MEALSFVLFLVFAGFSDSIMDAGISVFAVSALVVSVVMYLLVRIGGRMR